MIILIACLGFLVAIAYTGIVYQWRRDRVWDWGNSAISAAVSVTLATATGIFLFHRQSAEQASQDRARWTSLIVAENSEMLADISGNPMNVNITENGVEKAIPIFITYVQPIAIEQAALSGQFSPEVSEKLLDLATAARAYNMKANYALQLLAQGVSSPNYSERVTHASHNLDLSRQNIRQYIDEVTVSMGK